MSKPWEKLSVLVGKWEGNSSGYSGEGHQIREYAPIVGEQFLHVQSVCTFPPSDKNPQGEIHEDVGIYSFDRSRNCLVLRSFHVEGFINQYAVDVTGDKAIVITHVSESVENGPPGLRARDILSMESEDEFTEVFELAFPGKDFQPCVWNRMRRVTGRKPE